MSSDFMAINQSNDVVLTKKLHEAVVNYGALMSRISSNIGSNYNDVVEVPAYTASLGTLKTKWDALAISADRLTIIMEKSLGLYEVWANEVSNFNSVITKSSSFRSVVESNIASIPMSFDVTGRHVFVTASAGVQAALQSEVNDILQHF